MSVDKPIKILDDIDGIEDEKDGSSHTLSALLSSYTLTNEAKNALNKQAEEIRALIFSVDYTKGLAYDTTYLLTVNESEPEAKEEFRFRSSSTTSVTVNKLLLLQYGLTDAQINEAIKEKTTRYWIVEKVKAKKVKV